MTNNEIIDQELEDLSNGERDLFNAYFVGAATVNLPSKDVERIAKAAREYVRRKQ